MSPKFLMTVLLPCCINHTSSQHQAPAGNLPPQNNTLFEHVADIPSPPGYSRLAYSNGSFAAWLRSIPLKADNTVYLYDGSLKQNQSAQFAVLAVPVGKKDLQQCADAVMRLRASYLREAGRNSEIWFTDNAGKRYQCPNEVADAGFESYLEKVYQFCGTSSLARQLNRVTNFSEIKPGDVLIKGGSPGHAVIVMDVAQNKDGEKVFMIAQSYMPAQSVHILKNPKLIGPSPWYHIDPGVTNIITPEWKFTTDQLMGW